MRGQSNIRTLRANVRKIRTFLHVAALYYSTAAISSGSPVGQAIRIRSNPSDTEGDTGGA